MKSIVKRKNVIDLTDPYIWASKHKEGRSQKDVNTD
jgi:hypothetical protein